MTTRLELQRQVQGLQEDVRAAEREADSLKRMVRKKDDEIKDLQLEVQTMKAERGRSQGRAEAFERAFNRLADHLDRIPALPKQEMEMPPDGHYARRFIKE